MFKLIIVFGELGLHFSTLTSLFLNLFLCVDLILILWAPFEVTRARANRYLMISMAMALVLVLIIYFNQDVEIMNQNIYYDFKTHGLLPKTETELESTDTSNLILAMCLSVYILVALYSTIFSMRRLKRPGMSA